MLVFQKLCGIAQLQEHTELRRCQWLVMDYKILFQLSSIQSVTSDITTGIAKTEFKLVQHSIRKSAVYGEMSRQTGTNTCI